MVALLMMVGTARAGWEVGSTLPDLSTMHLQRDVPSLTGRVVVIDFWASWCVPCKASFPDLDTLYKEYGPKGVLMLGVSVDDTLDEMQEFLKENPISFATAWDSRQALAEAVGLEGMPTGFIFDRTGALRFVHRGYYEETTVKEYRAQIEQLLGEGGVTNAP